MELINSYTISFFCFPSELSCDWEMYWTAALCWLQVLRVLLTHATKGSLSFTHCYYYCVYCYYVMWLEYLLLNFFYIVYSCRKKKQEHNVFALYYCGVVWTCTPACECTQVAYVKSKEYLMNTTNKEELTFEPRPSAHACSIVPHLASWGTHGLLHAYPASSVQLASVYKSLGVR